MDAYGLIKNKDYYDLLSRMLDENYSCRPSIPEVHQSQLIAKWSKIRRPKHDFNIEKSKKDFMTIS